MFGINWLVLAFIQLGHYVLQKLLRPRRTILETIEAKRLADPLFAVRNPETPEMRAIYREIDAVAEITDPDIVTPSDPAAPKARPGAGWLTDLSGWIDAVPRYSKHYNNPPTTKMSKILRGKYKS